MTDTEIAATARNFSCPTCGMDNRWPCLDGGAVHSTRAYRAYLDGFIRKADMDYVIRQFPYGIITPDRAA